MKRTYEVRDRADKRAIREFLKREGQFLLPMLELVEQTEVAIDEVIQVMGRATIEAVLEMSAEGVAGVKQAGRSRAEDDTVWYGRQGGVVYLSDRKVRVERPRLRRRGAGEGGEVEVPAYAAMRRPGAVADRMLEVLMAGVSTRKYGRVIGEMADTVGVSKSAVSRETVEASERVLKELMERRLDAWDLLVIYLDGIQMGSHHVLAAVGVDSCATHRFRCRCAHARPTTSPGITDFPVPSVKTFPVRPAAALTCPARFGRWRGPGSRAGAPIPHRCA